MVQNQTSELKFGSSCKPAASLESYGPYKVRDLAKQSGAADWRSCLMSSPKDNKQFPESQPDSSPSQQSPVNTPLRGTLNLCPCTDKVNMSVPSWCVCEDCGASADEGVHYSPPALASAVAGWRVEVKATVANLLSTLNNNRKPT